MPLYPPTVVHQALMHDPRSRVAACNASASLPVYEVPQCSCAGGRAVAVRSDHEDRHSVDAFTMLACCLPSVSLSGVLAVSAPGRIMRPASRLSQFFMFISGFTVLQSELAVQCGCGMHCEAAACVAWL